MRLIYEIAGDDRQLRRVLRGVEAEAKAMNRRVSRDAQAAPVAQARRASVSTSGRAELASAKALERQRLQAIKNEERTRLQADRNVSRAAEQLDRQRARGLLQQIRQSEREQTKLQVSRERTARRIGSGAATSLTRGVGTAARIGGAALGLLGGFSAAGALEEQLSIRRKASQLAISAGTPGEKGAIEKEALGVKGFTGTETLGAMQGFVEKTGDLGAARGLIQSIGELSLATSADFGEMGSAAGQAFNVIRDTIKDPKEQLAAVRDVMRTLAAQGNLGAVEIKDMATELAGLGAATRKFEGGPVELIKTVGAMAQAAVARGGAASAPEATTAVTRFAQDIVQNQKGFAASGVNVFADKQHTKLRGPEDIMGDILEKTGGDLTKINELFGVYAERAVGGFSPLFIDAEKKQKGSGRAAVKAEYAKFKDAGLTDPQVQERANLRLSDPDLQIKETMKQFNSAVGEQLIPVLTQAIPKFVEAIPAIAKFTEGAAKTGEYLLENPFKGIGAIIALSVTKDIAAAGLGSLLQKLFTTILAGGATTAAGGVAGAAGTSGAAAGVAGGIGLAAGAAGLAALVGVGAAAYEGQGLVAQSGGLSGVYAGIGGVLAGRGYAGGVDDYMNERARQETYRPGPLGGWFDKMPGELPTGQQKPGAPQQTTAEQVKRLFGPSTLGLVDAAKELSSAAKLLKTQNGPEASRTAPINSPSRG